MPVGASQISSGIRQTRSVAAHIPALFLFSLTPAGYSGAPPLSEVDGGMLGIFPAFTAFVSASVHAFGSLDGSGEPSGYCADQAVFEQNNAKRRSASVPGRARGRIHTRGANIRRRVIALVIERLTAKQGVGRVVVVVIPSSGKGCGARLTDLRKGMGVGGGEGCGEDGEGNEGDHGGTGGGGGDSGEESAVRFARGT